MFERKITRELEEWKTSGGKKKAIVIKGLRQVGKTFAVKAFCEANYENVVYIDFKASPKLKAVFDEDLNVERIILDLSALIPGSRFVPGKSVLIFDEVQECSGARAAIKPFMEDGRFDIVCTGSLLGIKGYNKKRGQSVPVGFEHTVYMKPMDFEEFLWAKGVSAESIEYVKNCYRIRQPVREPVHSAFLRYFREYICVGGLPYVVDRFLATNSMAEVRKEQTDLLEEYRDDFGKHLDENERETTDISLLSRINRVFNSIPAQLAKENKKFNYSLLEKKGRSEQYQAAIQWLIDTGILNICYNLSNLEPPFEGSKIDNVFKLYMQDSGLFVAMLEEGSAGKILSGELGMYKGAIYENIVADAFSKQGRALYYYHKDSGLEIDFITMEQGEPCLIEVKAKDGNTKSADTILKNSEKYKVNKCIKLSAGNVGISEKKISLPYYMAPFLE